MKENLKTIIGKKETRTGKRYESDATLFKRLLAEFKENNKLPDSEISVLLLF